ncbi:MAG: aminotransferase class I/II-fold pyridoxal phosphate-dependent enzyme, partial [Planctomycetota bacterium]
HLTSNATSIAQRAALAAITGDQSSVGEMRAIFQERRDTIVASLGAIEGIEAETPRGAFYSFVKVDGFYGKKAGIDGSVALCEALLEEEMVATVPGAAFGDDAYIRLSFATSKDNIERGIARLGAFLGRLNRA